MALVRPLAIVIDGIPLYPQPGRWGIIGAVVSMTKGEAPRLLDDTPVALPYLQDFPIRVALRQLV